MVSTQSALTLTLGDVATMATLIVIGSGALGLYIRLFVTAELVRQENRITEKIKLQFAQKEITELQMKDIRSDLDELKNGRRGID